jgi:hypothetical protein
MACSSATLSGIALDCGNTGGLKKIYIANISDVSSIVVDDSGEITTLAMDAGKTFKSYSFRKGNASFTVTGARDEKNGTYFAKTTINIQFNKMEKTKRAEMVQLVRANAYVIILDNNGTYWFVGKDSYVAATAGNGQSGAGMNEGNFYSLTLESETVELPNTIAPGVVTISVVDSL